MQISLEELRKVPITHVVSLGPRCATAYNLRRFFNFGDAFPFDWWITPHEALLGVLGSLDVDVLYDPAQLELTEDGCSVRHKALGVLFHHEFYRDWGLAGSPIRPGWHESISIPKQRTKYLLGKFSGLNILGNRVLFVRAELGSGEVADEICQCLDSIFASCVWSFISIDVQSSGEFDWKGDPEQWDHVLSSLGVELDDKYLKPFSDKSEPERESKIIQD